MLPAPLRGLASLRWLEHARTDQFIYTSNCLIISWFSISHLWSMWSMLINKLDLPSAQGAPCTWVTQRHWQGAIWAFVTFVQQVAATLQLLQFLHFWHFWTIHSCFSSLMLFEYRILHWSWDQSSVVLRPCPPRRPGVCQIYPSHWQHKMVHKSHLSKKNNRGFLNWWFNDIDRFYSINNVNIDNIDIYHHLQTLSLQELNSPSCRSCALADKRIGIQ